jgi:hypothetical protein
MYLAPSVLDHLHVHNNEPALAFGAMEGADQVEIVVRVAFVGVRLWVAVSM